MKESPAPTVSTTVTRGASAATVWSRVKASAPWAPRVTRTTAGPRESQRAATAFGSSPGYSQARSSSLALTRSLRPTQRSTRVTAGPCSPIRAGRTLGS